LFNYGIALGYQQPYGGKAAAFYSVTSANYLTSMQIWAPKTSYIYGGKYISPNDSAPHDAPTVITGGSLVAGGWTVTATSSTPSGNATFPYLLDVTLTAANAQVFASVFNDAGISALWGTGDCNNDSLYMSMSPPTNGGLTLPSSQPASAG
jgi:hypothetical protein